jgi:hypothetical protein
VSIIDEYNMSMEHWWNDRHKNQVLGKKHVKLPIYPSEIPYGLAQQ